MIVRDIIYGRVDITEPILTELLRTPSVLRLKKIQQYGLPAKWYHKLGFDRYEHSVGVLLLLRRLKASLDEQVAGLLHDVSHTAFSHIIDWVIGDPSKENYQDKNHRQVIERSEIPAILARFQIDIEKIIDFHHYPLLEREAPDLCADRVDYTLRELHYSRYPRELIDLFLAHLTVHEGKIVFSSCHAARAFGVTYLKCQKEHWGGIDATFRYFVFSRIINVSLKEGVLKLEDFGADDEFVMSKLLKGKNSAAHSLMKLLIGKLTEKTMRSLLPKDLKKKFRYVDPEFLEHEKLYRLSHIDQEFKEMLREEQEKAIYQ